MYPSTAVHNIGGYARIKGSIDIDILKRSFEIFIEENNGVRLYLTEVEGEPMQYVSCFHKPNIQVLDFSKESLPEKTFLQWVEGEAQKPFELIENPLFKIVIFKISANDIGYLIKFHHVILDGWSISLMTSQVKENYEKLIKVKIIDKQARPCYLDYLEQEEEYMLSKRFSKNKDFWNSKFDTLPDLNLLKSSDNLNGKRNTYVLDNVTSKMVRDYITENKYSLNTFFTAILLVFYYKLYKQNDMTIGVPVFNRAGKNDKNTIGMYTSSVPFRVTIKENNTVQQFIKEVNNELKKCLVNQKYPYNLLANDLELRKKGYSTLFTKCVNYYNTNHSTQFDGFAVENNEFYNGSQVYSFQLIIKEWLRENNISLDMDYKINDYSEADIDRIYKSILNLIDEIITNKNITINQLDLLSTTEKKHMLYDFNDTHTELNTEITITDLFRNQVKSNPQKIAIECNHIALTYRELDQKSNQMARYLIEKNVGSNSIVGILAKHSIELIISILGIIKAGATYLPLDSNYPKERIINILSDAKVSCLLTNLNTEKLGFDVYNIININNQEIYTLSSEDINYSKPYKTAYLIYTSGSTGIPKGVMISHKSLLNYVLWASKKYVKSKEEVFALYSSIAFDLTVTTIFTPLISGVKTIIYEDNEDEYVLYRILREKKSTVVKLTPSHLMLIKDLDNSDSSIKRFVIGGEDLKTAVAKAVHNSFKGDIELYNEYGPTEATVGCMIYKFNPNENTGVSVPIGTPADNVQIYILDENLRPVPYGVIGEIYISGDGISQGYLNRDKLTKQKFLPNPFVDNSLMYKTGDLGLLNNSGVIEYKGRSDDQVKIRGYRIELGEIEKCIMDFGSIKNVTVVYREKNNSIYLSAYLILNQAGNEEQTINDLKSYVGSYLPHYMIPNTYTVIDEFPLTVNGKINKELLPVVEIEVNNLEQSELIESEESRILQNAIRKTLGISSTKDNDNFYDLGGDSIKAIQISSSLSQYGYKIKVMDILNNPVISDMTKYIEKQNQSSIAQEPCTGEIISTPIVHWFEEQKFSNPNFYNQSVLLKLKIEISSKEINNIINKLIITHDSLRINYNSVKKQLFYNDKYPNSYKRIGFFDLSKTNKNDIAEEIKLISYELKSSLDLNNDILFKSALINVSENESYLFLTAHHFLIDGVSWRIIIEDLTTMLGQYEQDKKLEIPKKTNSYQQWAKKLFTLADDFKSNELEYWQKVCNCSTSIPKDMNNQNDFEYSTKTQSINISKETTQKLITTANKSYNSKPEELLITAMYRAIYSEFNCNDFIIELESHGRQELFQDIDTSRTVGWFTSIYPVRINLKENDISRNIMLAKEELRNVPNKGIGYGVLKYIAKADVRGYEKTIRFNFLGSFDDVFDNSLIEYSYIDTGSDMDKSNKQACILEFNLMVINNELRISTIYSTRDYKSDTISNFLNIYENEIEKVIEHCVNKKGIRFTPSDFDTINFTQDELDSLFK